MDDDTLKRAIMILATTVAYVLASRLADRFVDQPEVRGVRDEGVGLLSASSSLLLTVVASVVIRRVVGNR